MASQELKNKLNNYSNRLIAKFGRNNKLPATIIGAEFRRTKKVDHSGKPPEPISTYLKNKLVNDLDRQLGEKGHKYRVGCCCEVRASNQIYLTLGDITSTRNIVFTEAKRPRTNQVINRCQNCQLIFS